MIIPDCKKCIFPLLRGCPVMGSINNAACLNLYKDRETCRKEDCYECRWRNYCKRRGFYLG